MDHEPLRYIVEPEQYALLEEPKNPHHARFSRTLLFLLVLVMIVLASSPFFLPAPRNFPEDTVLSVSNGETISGIAGGLVRANIIRSPLAFKASMVFFGGPKGLIAGDYYLERSQNVIALSRRLSHGSYALKEIRITIPEGTSSKEIASLFTKEKKFNHFNAGEFIKIAAPYEGYLFPDTYLFLPSITAPDVVDAMLLNYQKRILTLATDIKAYGKPIKDVINMASIIEEEARTDETRQIIAGILWKRLAQGMPLQVDAAFAFVNGKKASSDLTLDDLKIDSPYNTYVHKGLPPTPISNPGLDAIHATVHPVKTAYYFYLSDGGGTMHYAVTHDEHVANKDRYLR